MTDAHNADSPDADTESDRFAAEPEATTGTRAGPIKDYDYHVLSNRATMQNLRYGVRYSATVNNTKPYGIFVALNDEVGDGDDISGLVHTNNIPNMYTPQDFEKGDKVGVMLYDVRDSDHALSFELVAVFKSYGAAEQFENEPMNAPDPEIAPAFNRELLTEVLADADDADAAQGDADADPEADSPADAEPDTDATSASEDDADDADADAAAAPDDDGDSSDRQQRVINAVADAAAAELEPALDEIDDHIAKSHGQLHRLLNEMSVADNPRPSAWPGRYTTIAALLKDAVEQDHAVERMDYDDDGDTRTITIVTREVGGDE